MKSVKFLYQYKSVLPLSVTEVSNRNLFLVLMKRKNRDIDMNSMPPAIDINNTKFVTLGEESLSSGELPNAMYASISSLFLAASLKVDKSLLKTLHFSSFDCLEIRTLT